MCLLFSLHPRYITRFSPCSRGPNLMRGYYNNPKATDETVTRDGWFKSGDLANIDEEGFVYIKDRGKVAN